MAMSKKSLKFLSVLAGTAALMLAASQALSLCGDGTGGTTACGQNCGAAEGYACDGASGGITYTGMCVGGHGQSDCQYVRCSGLHGPDGAVCAQGPFGKLGCQSDGECETGEVCVSDSGEPGCGTDYSVCMQLCPTTTTTTTSTTTTT